MEALGALLILDLGVIPPDDFVRCGRYLVVAVRGQLDQIDLVLLGLLRLIQVVELAEQARNDLVVK